MKNSELSTYQADIDSKAYLAPPQYYLNQTSSYESDSSYAPSEITDEEDVADSDAESADDGEQVTMPKASAKPTPILKKAPGNKPHKANQRRSKAPPVGASTRLPWKWKIVDPDGNTYKLIR